MTETRKHGEMKNDIFITSFGDVDYCEEIWYLPEEKILIKRIYDCGYQPGYIVLAKGELEILKDK